MADDEHGYTRAEIEYHYHPAQPPKKIGMSPRKRVILALCLLLAVVCAGSSSVAALLVIGAVVALLFTWVVCVIIYNKWDWWDLD